MHNKPRQSLGDDVEALFDRQVFKKIRFQMIDDNKEEDKRLDQLNLWR